MEDYQEIMEEFAGEFGEAPTDGEEQRFKIDSDAKAEWAIRKIAEEEAERDRLTAVCQEEIDRYTERQEFYAKRCEGRTANLRAMLLLYFGTVPVKDTKTQQKYELPSGSLVISAGQVDFDDRRILNEMHKSYHDGLGGNGDLDNLMSEVNKLPLK